MKMPVKMIKIVVLVDVLGALASENLHQNIYFMDNNKENGSSEEASETLKTVVEDEDIVMWNVMTMEPEAYVSISNIEIDNDFCRVQEARFEESDITYWIGKIKGNPKNKYVYYKIKFKLGTHDKELMTENSPCLVFVKRTN